MTTDVTAAGSGLTFRITYDASVASAPSQFTTSVESTLSWLAGLITDSLIINIAVGYGTVNGVAITPGAVAKSTTFTGTVTYAAMRAALALDADPASQSVDTTTLASLPTTDPVDSVNTDADIVLARAQAKALGLLSPTAGSIDAAIGFSTTVTFDYNNADGVTSGAFDFFGTAIHEVTETMGRILNVGGAAGANTILDYLHYTAAATRTFVGNPGTATASYFSIDGGTTNLGNFNKTSGADFGDWATGGGANALNAFGTTGVVSPVTAADMIAMDAIGWDLTSVASNGTTAAPLGSTLSSATTGSTGPGSTVTLTLTTNEMVFVTGTPTLKLNNGATATYAAGANPGSATSALAFRYTVGLAGSGQDTANLATAGTNALTGTIKDLDGNTMSVNGANAVATGTLAVDVTLPTVSLANDPGLLDVVVTASEAATARIYAAGSNTLLKTQSVGAGATTISLAGLVTYGSQVHAQLTDAAGNLSAVSSDIAICFMPGTGIATPDGSLAVEALAIGDLVTTADGGIARVRWIGRQTIATRFADPARTLPIRIHAGALGENLPIRDLLVSPDHALALHGVLIQAGALVNVTTITREHNVPDTFTYFHVELDSHDLILAEGVPAETFLDTADRLAFDNWDEHAALYGHLPPMQGLDLPRARAWRQVPMALRRTLNSRATALGHTGQDAA